jgi:preprotein translocase subunit YajC
MSPNTIFPMLIMSVMLITILVPQFLRQRKHSKFIKELSTGTAVYTQSGIIGTIVKVDEREVLLQVDDKTKLRVVKSTIMGAYGK